MANIKSSEKDIRRSRKRAVLNRQERSRLRTYDKRIRGLIEAGKIEEARAEFRVFTTYLDRADRKNLIHHRQADRRKGRLAVALNRKTA